ncbi:nitronate monooxygenase [Aneurinibacillus sp. Ricciae_BoGa-3]|uniref:NAD(P)H-dependent flavin oxidoreductase n=1 Tax=Aneurinibacillus sp. Ricciae_BoGa-3 TaxID=3022697 RepID=UPI0023406C85|nr:nitronate monooxygenase [Aneurinibacillus sp. Ricciae_BoGa-3]WCK56525.1 nitronate monooxygenase [Aneurinibacillus sp. Ricciae_BoGa-3]
MWSDTKLTELLGIKYPIIQGGMAGRIASPERLVAAVSNAGGLGTLGAGYMSPDQIRSTIKYIRTLTDKPFAVNLFAPDSYEVNNEDVARMNNLLRPYYEELGIESQPLPAKFSESFAEQLAVILEENVPIFSFTFGVPAKEHIQQLKNKGIFTIGTATTVKEGMYLEESGIDMIVGQGSEAGGHRGTFMGSYQDGLIGTMALIPQLADAVHIPVIAAGGIMDHRGLIASLALGAAGIQMGTAFLTCAECGAHHLYKQTVLGSAAEDTAITTAFSGKAARGLKNRFMVEMQAHASAILPYPVQNALTKNMRSAAENQNQTEFMSLWAGQGSSLSKTWSVSEFIAELIKNTNEKMGAQ